MAAHNQLGLRGEQAAVEYLVQHGYTIRHRNWRCGHKELDIVAQQGNLLVVVEVKTRRNDWFGNPAEAVTHAKIRRIVQSTDAYLRYFQLDWPVRFDIITLLPTKQGFQIDHIPDAFFPPLSRIW